MLGILILILIVMVGICVAGILNSIGVKTKLDAMEKAIGELHDSIVELESIAEELEGWKQYEKDYLV